MASKMALKVAKGALQNTSSKKTDQDPTPTSVDHAHYRGAKVEKQHGQLILKQNQIAKGHRKDSAYFEYKGIPEKDAKILSRVVGSARYLDNGIKLGPLKFGANTIIELVPGLGDFAGTGASLVLVVVPAWRVSKGPGTRKVRWILLRNLSLGFAIGLTPVLGDIADSWLKYNVNSASELEKMLLKRVDKSTMRMDAEKVGRTTGYQHQNTNGHLLAATNGHYDTESPTHQPQRYITANDLRQDPKPAATARAPTVQTQPRKIRKNFFQRRGEPQGRQEIGPAMEEVAPGRPPRPIYSGHERGGYL